MGVEYLTCEMCGGAFPNVREYVWCGCGKDFCSDGCAEDADYVEGYTDINTGKWVNSSCAYCRGEQYTDSQLLEYALKLLGITEEELIAKKRKEVSE